MSILLRLVQEDRSSVRFQVPEGRADTTKSTTEQDSTSFFYFYLKDTVAETEYFFHSLKITETRICDE